MRPISRKLSTASLEPFTEQTAAQEKQREAIHSVFRAWLEHLQSHLVLEKLASSGYFIYSLTSKPKITRVWSQLETKDHTCMISTRNQRSYVCDLNSKPKIIRVWSQLETKDHTYMISTRNQRSYVYDLNSKPKIMCVQNLSSKPTPLCNEPHRQLTVGVPSSL